MLEDTIENTPELAVVETTTPEPVGSEKDANGALLLMAYTGLVIGVTVAATYGIGKLRKSYDARVKARYEKLYGKPLTSEPTDEAE